MTAADTPPEDLGSVVAQNLDVTPRPTRPSVGAPLRLRTNEANIQSPADPANSNPDHQPTSAAPPGLGPSHTSPKTERLPSFRQLSKIADAAEEETSRTPTYPPPPPAASIYPVPAGSGQSPVLQHPYPPTAQISPSHAFAYPTQTSPASLQSDAYYPTSPPSATFSTNGSIYQPRRGSFPISAPGPRPPPPNSMPTSSSSGGSYTQTSSVTDGPPSTAQTTPAEAAGPIIDLTQRPAFPVQSGLSAPVASHPGPWYCDHPGCTAAPFPTQYLLNSHATSHSTSRPHYCPVAGCSRGEGGKGFKRKNEMIRHGLTHDTPGYVCPFCPDRGHKYPRPDNLQRHVRVHHIDKDRDDPLLREVLSQRVGGSGGSSRGRRRRTGP